MKIRIPNLSIMVVSVLTLLTSPMLGRASAEPSRGVEAAKAVGYVAGGAVGVAGGAAIAVGAGATVAMNTLTVATAIGLGLGYGLIIGGIGLAGYGVYKGYQALFGAPPAIVGNNVGRGTDTRPVATGPQPGSAGTVGVAVGAGMPH